MIRVLLFTILALCAAPLQAETLHANPITFHSVARDAKAGDTIVLDQRWIYGDLSLPRANHAVPVTIMASGTRARSLTIRQTAGWKWMGGTIASPLPPAVWVNVFIDNSDRIEIVGTTLTGGQTGVLVTRGSQDITLRNNIATGLRSDGFNIATASRVSLVGNMCTEFRPIPPVYRGTRLIKDGTHPDCIQVWSENGKPATSDIFIVGNRIGAGMQGITNFGARPPERVFVWNNDISMAGYWWAIAMNETTGADVRNNKVRTIQGSRAVGRPDLFVQAMVETSDHAVRCGNEVDGDIDRQC
ncbi:hypothetical protein [Qipengyuania sp.]|uniref:hypothetical protein n=1 Tax=Qipengyuania sp. TaxID=2004515 RepID=UPI0035C85C34